MKPRRLLLISYHFPPSNEVAGKPTARLVRYLRDYGWEATVLTIPKDDPRVMLDPAGYADVLAQNEIERVPRGWNLFDLAVAGNRTLKGIRGSAVKPAPPAAFNGSTARTLTLKQRLKQGIREWLEFPDSQASWVKPAVRRARQLIGSGRFSAVMTVSPPQSAHLIGLALKRWSRLPWIAQFHDPWVGNPFHVPSLRFLERQTEKLERQIVRAADTVLGATEENTSRMVHRYSDQSSDKFDTLCNGFDPLDFPPLESEGFKVEQPLTMTYTGCLYGDRNPFPLLEGLAHLVERNEVRAGDVRIRLIGDCQHAVGRSIAEAVQKLRLENFVSIERPVSYPDALSALAQSHVLLLFAQNQPAQVPAKLYEYLHLNRFILGFTSGASAGIIERTGAGEVIYGDSVEDVTKCLRRILALHRGEGLLDQRVSDESLRPYTATYLAEFLAAKLDRLVGEHRVPAPVEETAEQSAV